MEFSVPIYKHDNLTIIKTPFLSSFRSKLVILDIILALVICIFILCLLSFIRHEKRISNIKSKTSLSIINQSKGYMNISRKTGYYDFEPYLNNEALQTEKKIRRYFYIDLGCFDGRDTAYFIHFHLEEVSRLGTLNVIAFEPDPINFSACKSMQQQRMPVNGTVYETAAWTENGKVRYATEKGQKSRIDQDSVLYVRSIDFSQWLADNFNVDDYVYIKFTIEGVEIPILEKMIIDETLALVDYMEVEWNDGLSPDLEPRRVALECMFDNFGMDFLYMINPVDLRHAFNVKDTFSAVPKDKGWKLKDSSVRFHYKTRKDVPDLIAERLRQKQQI